MQQHQLDFKISVNLSGQTLALIGNGDIDLSDYLIPKNQLRLEILEDIVINEYTMSHVAKIISKGYTIAIDDFGSGCTSLKYVKEPMFKIIKIDRSLVPVEMTEDSKTVIKSQIDMLQELEKRLLSKGLSHLCRWSISVPWVPI